jgi:hypothetical protein
MSMFRAVDRRFFMLPLAPKTKAHIKSVMRQVFEYAPFVVPTTAHLSAQKSHATVRNVSSRSDSNLA